MRKPEQALRLIEDQIMFHATKWAQGEEISWGIAAGLTHAYLFLTNDRDGYNEYYAMLGVSMGRKEA